MLFYFHLPAPKTSLGYYVKMNDTVAQFQDLIFNGDTIYDKGDENKWHKILPKIKHAMHKLLILPFY